MAKRRVQDNLADELNSADTRGEIFRIAKQMIGKNRDVVGEQCVRNDLGNVCVDTGEIRDAWKCHYNRLLNEEFPWDRDNLDDVEPVQGPPLRIECEWVKTAIDGMKNDKAAGSSGIVAEMLKAAGDIGVRMMTDLANVVIRECSVPDDWLKSVIINIYKGKGDALERGNYRGLKLLDHGMKVVERVLERLIREKVSINEMQFGFMPGRGTTEAIFIVRQMQEKYLGKKRKLYFIFVDLEKAFDRVPREVVQWSMRKLLVEEWIVRVVMAMYDGSRTSVRVDGTQSEEFVVKVGVHQGSVLSPLLFIMVLEALSQEFRVGLPLEMLYADDLVLMAESMEEVTERYTRWKVGMETKGLRVNVGKTKVMVSEVGGGSVTESGQWPCAVCKKGVGRNSIKCNVCSLWVHGRCSGIRGRLREDVAFSCSVCAGNQIAPVRLDRLDIGDMSLECVDEFCYLGDMISAGGGAEAGSVARIRSGWKKFRELLPLLTLRGPSLHFKGKLYSACVRSVMLYGSETWAIKREDEQRYERNEMRMVRWMCGASLRDGMHSAELRDRLGIESIGEVLRRGRLRWFGHVERMPGDQWAKRCMSMNVEGDRARGRPRKTWNEVINGDLRAKNVNRVTAMDRAAWKAAIR